MVFCKIVPIFRNKNNCIQISGHNNVGSPFRMCIPCTIIEHDTKIILLPVFSLRFLEFSVDYIKILKHLFLPICTTEIYEKTVFKSLRNETKNLCLNIDKNQITLNKKPLEEHEKHFEQCYITMMQLL